MISRWGYDDDFALILGEYGAAYEAFSGRRLLVTGATGLVGTCVVELLLYLKKVRGTAVDVTVVASSPERMRERFGAHLDDGSLSGLVQDIREPLPEGLDFDGIIHAAAVADPRRYVEEPVDVIDVSVSGTRNVLECARRAGAQVVYVSSVEVYGETAGIAGDVTEDVFGHVDPFCVRSSYTESKRLGETLCQAYHVQYGVDTVVARLSKTYGPSNSDSDTRVMAFVLNQVARHEDITLNSDGSRIFSFCYVTDAATALLTLLLNGKPGEAYNVSDRNSVASLKEIAEASARLAGVTVHLQPTDNSVVSVDTVVNSDKLEALGWQARTSIHDGLEKQYRCMKAHRDAA